MIATQPAQTGWRSRFGDLRHYWFMLLFTLAFHFPLFVPGVGMPHWGDFYSFHSPMRIVAAEALHKGQMPFLTQAIYGGYPLYSDPQFAFFYPVNFLFSLVVPDPNSEVFFDAFILVNLVALSLAALYFMCSFGFGRAASVIAAVIIAFNGFVHMHITHINILQVMATGYLAAGLLVRFAWTGGTRWRMALGAAFALAAGNLAGHPQTTMFLHYAMGVGMVALCAGLWKRHRDTWTVVRILGWSAAAVVLGVLMAAVQLLPTAHLISICARMQMSRAEAMGEAIRFQHLPSMLFPGFYVPLRWEWGWPMYVPRHIQWLAPNPLEALTFSGVIAMGLGLLGFFANLRYWPAHLLFWTAMFLLGASVGEQLPFYGLLYDYVPMVDVVRVPSRVLWMFYTAWAMLAAMGIRACMGAAAARPGRWTLYFMLGGFWIAILIVLGSYRTSWYQAFVALFVDYHYMYDDAIAGKRDIFMTAMRDQFFFGAVFVLFALGWMWWVARRGGSRRAVWLVLFAMCLELFVYGFARSYIMDYPPKGKVQADPYNAFSFDPKGRALMPHFVHGGGAMNAAMINGIWIANGYSVTYPEWVRAFELSDVPPWRHGMDEKLMEIWNVSDIVLRKRGAMAKMGPFDVPLDDWGWSEIGSPWTSDSNETSVSARALMPARLVMELDEITTPVIWMQVLSTSGGTFNLPDGTEIARAIAVPRDQGGTTVTFPIRLGTEVADSNYNQQVRHGAKPAHGQPQVAFERDALWETTDDAQLYFAGLNMPTTAPLSKLIFEATGPYPTMFAVSQVLFGMADGSLKFVYPSDLPGFSEIESADEGYRILHRDNPPGYVWMVPEAVRGSYKETGNIMWRMFNKDFDPRREVIVDKRVYEPENAAEIDSTRPEDYTGTATIKWHQPEHVEIHTTSNDQGWLVISMTWDKGWSAWLDGEPVELGRANGPHSALPIPAGEHTVILKYRPVYFIAGALISAAAAMGTLAPFFWRRRRAGSGSPAAP